MQENNIDRKEESKSKGAFDWIATIITFILLVLTLIIGTGEMIHGQLLRMGENLYGDPKTGMQYSALRVNPQKPSCERNINIDAQVQKQLAQNKNDEFADFFGTASEADIRSSLMAAQQSCEEKYQFYDRANAYIEHTPSVKVFRTIETSFFGLFQFGTENRPLILVLMVMIASIFATLHKHHIGLRPAVTKIDYKVHDSFMLVANGLLTYSCWMYIQMNNKAGVEIETIKVIISYLWLACFGILTLISAYKLIRPAKPLKAGGSFGLALLSVPLYAYMAIISGIAFTFFMDYAIGQAIYLGQLVEFVQIFISLALFIWAGMLLTQTQMMESFLNILRPWNFSPETLTWFILIAAAIPTAYTGASGIFVVAAGAIIYREVWNSGARRQYALAVSAMSGSLGVVIRPCLLVVLIAMLDSKHVTSDELFDHGIYVFWLTALLFLAVSLVLAESKFRINSPKIAVPGMIRALGPVVPYVIIGTIVISFYHYALNTKLDPSNAAMIIPSILVAMVFYDRVLRRQKVATDVTIAKHDALAEQHELKSPLLQQQATTHQKRGFISAVGYATHETIGHIGALIILMALSVSIGGLIEKTEVVHLLPTELGSIALALLFFALLLALIGMCTDPFGAVIIVATALAPVAYHNGIEPIHFWMICLVAFELGYVTPPVALNHLLTRLSVGDEEVMQADAEAKQKYSSFYYRYERWILPIIVLFPALMIVTFAPYVFKMFGWYQ